MAATKRLQVRAAECHIKLSEIKITTMDVIVRTRIQAAAWATSKDGYESQQLSWSTMDVTYRRHNKPASRRSHNSNDNRQNISGGTMDSWVCR